MKTYINGYTFTLKTFLQKRLKSYDGKYRVYIKMTYKRRNNQYPVKSILGEPVLCDENENIDIELIIKSRFENFNSPQSIIRLSVIEVLDIANQKLKYGKANVYDVEHEYILNRSRVESTIRDMIYSYKRSVESEYNLKYNI